MIITIISAAAVINLVLGILALTKGANRINLSFFFLSFLLAMWNLCVVMWAGGIEAAGKFNYVAISLIPAAGMFFVLSIFGITKGPLAASPFIILAPGIGIILITIGTVFIEPLKPFFDTLWYKIMIFAYLFIPLLFAFGVLIYRMHLLQYKQEKIKVAYIIAAFLILFAGGMIDLASGAKLIKPPFDYIGNICNMIYAVLIFIAIFRMRLFNVEVLFGSFISYSLIAMAAGGLFYLAALAFSGRPQIMGVVFFMLMFAVVYYTGRLRGFVFELREKMGALSKTEEARKECLKITAGQAEEGIKIVDTLLVLEKRLEMSSAVYIKGGDYYMISWLTAGSPCRDIVEGSALQGDIIIRYETTDKSKLALLDSFCADVVMPLVYSGSIIGALSGKKNTADISMAQDEVDLIREIGAMIAVYTKARLVQNNQVDDENMKRLGMMADQMAHEIKNPLTALWGAAQNIEGKSEADRESLSIIKDEMQRLKKILDSWRDYSRKITLDKKPVNLSVMAAEVVRVMSRQSEDTVITVSAEEGMADVSADAEKLKQVLFNVILNAVEACSSREKPEIRVTIGKKDRYADIKIRDNGEGIKKENLPRVKEALFTSKPKGSGLGLAISERIMKAHDGALILDSDGETYTEVTLSIPMKTEVKV